MLLFLLPKDASFVEIYKTVSKISPLNPQFLFFAELHLKHEKNFSYRFVEAAISILWATVKISCVWLHQRSEYH